MKTINVKKGQILQRKGDFNSKIYRVESGLLRSYSIDEKGKEHIFMFGPEGWFIVDNTPSSEPCELFIDALEDSTVTQMEKDAAKDHDAQPLIKRLLALQKRIIMLMSLSALERYDHFVETYPQIIQRVPQKMIASYLGITPEALSSAKSKRFQNK